MLEDAVGPPKYFASRSKTLILFWMLVDVTCTLEYADGKSKTLMLFWMLVDATCTLKDVTNIMTLQGHDMIESNLDNKVDDIQFHNPWFEL